MSRSTQSWRRRVGRGGVSGMSLMHVMQATGHDSYEWCDTISGSTRTPTAPISKSSTARCRELTRIGPV
jgi:hypothetical protein